MVVLGLDKAIANGDVVTVSYAATGTNNLGDGTTPVADFTNYAVTNKVEAAMI